MTEPSDVLEKLWLQRANELAKLWCESRHDHGLYSEHESFVEGHRIGYKDGALAFMEFLAEEMKLSKEGFYRAMVERFLVKWGRMFN
jgi:hypothetical protein